MSDKEAQIAYNPSFGSLVEVLQAVKRPGDYCCSGTHLTPLPVIDIAGVGVLSFPLPPEQARKVIKTSAVRAPYGRGDLTLVDESVRKVWQVSPSKIDLSGKGWERFCLKLVAEVAEGLGRERGSVGMELYKLLIYDAGGHFAPHRDTEKAPGMFGTLVVTLPTDHQGGDLVIRHQGRETVISLSGSDLGEVHYAAFYADCEHEVRPVKRGHRLCLVYNLIETSKGMPAPAAATENLPAVLKAAEVLSEWAISKKKPLKLVYLLEHHYTQAALSWTALKNGDAARAVILRAAADRSGCAIYLGMVHIVESGWAEYSGGYYGSRGGYGSDEDDEEEETESESESGYEYGEVCDGMHYIDQMRDGHDQPVAFGRLPLEDLEAIPPGALDGEKPDKKHFSEATGNEGASFERTYLRAALVIWPGKRADEIWLSAGLDTAMARLGQLVEASKSAKDGDAVEAQAQVARFVKRLPTRWSEDEDHAPPLMALFAHLASFGDGALILHAGQKSPLNKAYSVRLNQSLLACAAVLTPQQALSFFNLVFVDANPRQLSSLLELWKGLSKRFPALSGILTSMLAPLAEVARRAKGSSASARRGFRLYSGRFFLTVSDDDDIEVLDPEDAGAPLGPILLADFLSQASRSAGLISCRQFIDALVANADGYPTDSLLLPCVERLLKAGSGSAEIASYFWEQCAIALLGRSAIAPLPPKNWAQPIKIPGARNSAHLRELEAFARDPKASVHRFRLRKELRREIHVAIERAGLDMTHVTERLGTPQTLVCTKTRATYESACKKYERDVLQMKRLLELKVKETPDLKKTKTMLREALMDK